VTLFLAWAAWLYLARVPLYEVSDSARLEVGQAAYPIQVLATGRVVASHLALGAKVQAQEVVVELDTESERQRLNEERARLASFTVQREVLQREILAEEQAKRQDRDVGHSALEQADGRVQEAQAAEKFAIEKAQRLSAAHTRGFISEFEMLEAKAAEERLRAVANVHRIETSRLQQDLRTKESERKARIERLNREQSRLQGDIGVVTAGINRLAHEVENRRIRAPITGLLGDVSPPRIGAVVREGDKLGAVVPQGDLRVVAEFSPSSAVGRVRPGQPARLRLDAYPWAQYGIIAASVGTVGSEVRDGHVRVELTVHLDRGLRIPLQHGLPGSLEIEVERVSPATLALRTAGRIVTIRPTQHIAPTVPN
jgi:membrane fusion protein (multidrug efflux system)